jgi:hypothetical protein
MHTTCIKISIISQFFAGLTLAQVLSEDSIFLSKHVGE